MPQQYEATEPHPYLNAVEITGSMPVDEIIKIPCVVCGVPFDQPSPDDVCIKVV